MASVRVAAIQAGGADGPEYRIREAADKAGRVEAVFRGFVTPRLEAVFALLERAGREHADIVTTSEDISGLCGYSLDVTGNNIFPELVERSWPYVESRLSEIARKYSMAVVGCYYKTIGGQVYNVGAVYGRDGRIAGQYRKVHLPTLEKWQCAEGDSFDVFDLGFARIGIAICYDMMFPESVEVLALKGAQVIFHPTMGYGWYDGIGEATLRARANDNGVYIVTAKDYQFNHSGRSSIVDYWGHIRADAGFCENTIVFADIDPDAEKAQPKMHMSSQTSGVAEVTRRMRAERRPELYGEITAEIERIKLMGYEERIRFFSEMGRGEFFW